MSLLPSSIKAFEAAAVPAVIPSIVSNSASAIEALPMVKLVPVIAAPVMLPKVAGITVPENTSELLVAPVNPVKTPALSSNPKKPIAAAEPV